MGSSRWAPRGLAPLRRAKPQAPGVPERPVRVTGHSRARTRNRFRWPMSASARSGTTAERQTRSCSPRPSGRKTSGGITRQISTCRSRATSRDKGRPVPSATDHAQPGGELSERAAGEGHEHGGLTDEEQVQVQRRQAPVAEPFPAVDQEHHAPARGVVDESARMRRSQDAVSKGRSGTGTGRSRTAALHRGNMGDTVEKLVAPYGAAAVTQPGRPDEEDECSPPATSC